MTREDMLLLDAFSYQKDDFQRKRHMIIFYSLASFLGRMGGFCKTDLDIINASAILENIRCMHQENDERVEELKYFLIKAGYPESYFKDIIFLSSKKSGSDADKRKNLLDEARAITACIESEEPKKEAMKALKDFKSNTGLKLLMNLCLYSGF